MTRLCSTTRTLSLAVSLAGVLAFMTPVAKAETSCGTGCSVHFVGAGSSSQFSMAGIAADQAAIDANNALYNGANHIYHWSKNDGAFLSDNRDSLGRIPDQPGNVWLVWIEGGNGCTVEGGAGCSVTDIWADVGIDSASSGRQRVP